MYLRNLCYNMVPLFGYLTLLSLSSSYEASRDDSMRKKIDSRSKVNNNPFFFTYVLNIVIL